LARLQVALRVHNFDANGQRVQLTFHNERGPACTLKGFAHIELLSRDDKPLTTVNLPDREHAAPPIELDTGQSATVSLGWTRSSCFQGPEHPYSIAVAMDHQAPVQLRLPHRPRVSVCRGFVSVGPFHK
jgi:hypothetical protein